MTVVRRFSINLAWGGVLKNKRYDIESCLVLQEKADFNFIRVSFILERIFEGQYCGLE